MIVLSLVLVVAAAVSLLVGLFATESLALIFVAIGLCVASLALLFVGSRQRRQVPATSGGPVSYGAPPTAGAAAPSVTRPVSTPSSVEDEDEGEVVRKATAREAASKRVAAAGPVARVAEQTSQQAAPEEAPPVEAPASAEPQEAAAPAPKKVVKKAAAKKAAAKKATAKKATAKKATAKKTASKKAAAKSTTKKATKKASAKKSTKKASAKKAAKKTTGAAARAALDAVSGVGAAKQDALLKKFGSLEAIRAASEDEISQVDGFGPALAKRVKNELS